MISKGNRFRLKGKINQKEVLELQKVNQRGSNSKIEKGSIQKDRWQKELSTTAAIYLTDIKI